MPLKASVVLCTHNPRPDYLRRTLAALRAQTLPMDQWELLLVDNASALPLQDGWAIPWQPLARHIREDEVGLTAARLRGIRESAGELLVFVDDDNVLSRNYLQNALSIRSRHPYLGAYGAGLLEPEFETPPPPELTAKAHLLALRDNREVLWTNNFADWLCRPVGAGLCATREVAERFADEVEQLRVTPLLGRRGQDLFSGEDDLFSWAAVRLGFGFGVFPELTMTHLISARRLTREYFVRLIRGHAYSHGVLRYLLEGTRPHSFEATRHLLLPLHALRNGLFSMQCHWAELRGERLAAEFIAANGLQPLRSISVREGSED